MVPWSTDQLQGLSTGVAHLQDSYPTWKIYLKNLRLLLDLMTKNVVEGTPRKAEQMKLKKRMMKLEELFTRLQHWAHRLFPKMTFEDCIERIEELGHKREIQTNMHKLRMGMVDLNEGQEQVADDEEVRPASPNPPVDDAFDQLIMTAPAPVKQVTLTEEQRARMLRNRLLAEERRMARRLAREKELTEQRNAAASDSVEDGIPIEHNLMNQGPILFPDSTTPNTSSAVIPGLEAGGQSIPATIPTNKTLDDSPIEENNASNDPASENINNDVNTDLASMDVDAHDLQTIKNSPDLSS
ncbi:hypothetical protein GE061_016516 [Apolygus lucorum]|uniref:TIMELESS-interacting protein n=1 Tax=Apolygus lucorum TaxID=248454 RepID=A0A6A4IXU5_APOLU|nr:hypothetical protein GE061_016516 [Apolygus lucorum]